MTELSAIRQTFALLKEYRELKRRQKDGTLRREEDYRLKELRRLLSAHFGNRSAKTEVDQPLPAQIQSLRKQATSHLPCPNSQSGAAQLRTLSEQGYCAEDDTPIHEMFDSQAFFDDLHEPEKLG